jgi:hypothetical protein
VHLSLFRGRGEQLKAEDRAAMKQERERLIKKTALVLHYIYFFMKQL